MKPFCARVHRYDILLFLYAERLALVIRSELLFEGEAPPLEAESFINC